MLIVSRCAICDGSSELVERYAAKACGWSAVKRLLQELALTRLAPTVPALIFDMMPSMYHRGMPLLYSDAERCAKGQELALALWAPASGMNTLVFLKLHAFCPVWPHHWP